MYKLLKAVLITLLFNAVVFTGCKKNKAPDVPSKPSGPTSGSINTEYTFTSSAEDPDDDSIAIRFDWGHGDTSNWSSFVPSGDSVSLSHSWSDSGTYSIKAQAKDLNETGTSWSGGHQIFISTPIQNNPPNTPTTPVGDSIGSVNVSYFLISTASDPDGDSLAIRFDWGDGDTSNWSSWVESGNSISISHSWLDAGIYSVKAQAKDKNNATSDWSEPHIIVIALTFIRTFGGTSSDVGNSVQQTTDGGYIITGTTQSFSASEDVYLIKTDANGNLLWDKTFGGQSSDSGYSVQQTSDGGYIIVGTTNSFGGGSQIYLIKTDAMGNQLWYQTKGYDSQNDGGYSVQQISDSGYIIVGYTLEPPEPSYDILLIKTDANGNTVWEKNKGYDNYNDIGYSVRQTSDGGYIIVGETETSGALNDYDVFLIKTDANGDDQWFQLKGFDGWDDYGYSVQLTTDGGYIIAGRTKRFDNNGDVYLIKTDANGNTLWDNHFAGLAYDIGRSVQQTSDAGYIIAGTTFSYTGYFDVYLIKTDAGGNQQWEKTFGGADNDYGNSVQQTTDDGYIITGKKGGDVYLIKTDANGNVE